MGEEVQNGKVDPGNERIHSAVEKTLAAQEQEARIDPICPYCGAEPANFTLRQVATAGYTMAMVFCANQKCRRLLPVQVLSMAIQQPRIIKASPGPGGIAL